MGTRGEDSNCPFAISTLRRKLRKPNNWSPGPAGYRELFTDEALLLRARNCDVHQGDWAVVLPVVAAFLAAIPAAADTLSIAQAARSDPRFDSLSVDDRRLALALLSYSDSLRIYTTVHGHREAIGQPRICAARTAGVTHLPVWYDSRSPRPAGGRHTASAPLGSPSGPTGKYHCCRSRGNALNAPGARRICAVVATVSCPTTAASRISPTLGTHHRVGWSPSSAASTAAASHPCRTASRRATDRSRRTPRLSPRRTTYL